MQSWSPCSHPRLTPRIQFCPSPASPVRAGNMSSLISPPGRSIFVKNSPPGFFSIPPRHQFPYDIPRGCAVSRCFESTFVVSRSTTSTVGAGGSAICKSAFRATFMACLHWGPFLFLSIMRGREEPNSPRCCSPSSSYVPHPLFAAEHVSRTPRQSPGRYFVSVYCVDHQKPHKPPAEPCPG